MLRSFRLDPDPVPRSPLSVPPQGVEWAVAAFDDWVEAGRAGMITASAGLWALALLAIALEDHLASSSDARVVVVVADQPLLAFRSLATVFPGARLSSYANRLTNSQVVVYGLADLSAMKSNILEIQDGPPVMLAALGLSAIGQRALRFLNDPYCSRLGVETPGTLTQPTINRLHGVFGLPIRDGRRPERTVSPGEARPIHKRYDTAMERELAILFGDDWRK